MNFRNLDLTSTKNRYKPEQDISARVPSSLLCGSSDIDLLLARTRLENFHDLGKDYDISLDCSAETRQPRLNYNPFERKSPDTLNRPRFDATGSSNLFGSHSTEHRPSKSLSSSCYKGSDSLISDRGNSKPSKMRVPTGSPLDIFTYGGFYDHFDSVFHGLTSPRSNRKLINPGQVSRSKGKEYIIPIKVEKANSDGTSNVVDSRSYIPDLKSSSPGRVIHIPIKRVECDSPRDSRHRISKREKPYRDHNQFSCKPTTDEHIDRLNRKTNVNDIVWLDEDDFFPKSKARLLESEGKSKPIYITDDEEEIVSARKGLNRPLNGYSKSDDVRVDTQVNFSRPNRYTSSFDYCVPRSTRFDDILPRTRIDDVLLHDDVSRVVNGNKVDDSSESETVVSNANIKQYPCGKPGSRTINAPPSYVTYDILKTK